MSETKWNVLYFEEWVKKEGLDLIRGNRVDNVYAQPLKPWKRTGGAAVMIQLDGCGELNAAYVQEIPPGGELKPQRHLYEELVFVLAGQGSTSVWCEERKKNHFEWQAGSLFTIPLNAWHQHFNGSGSAPARYISVTTAPIILNLIRNEDFIFNNDAVFPERYNSEEDYFSGKVHWETFTGWDKPTSLAFSNFFADINGLGLRESTRGSKMRSMSFELGNGVLGAHTSLFPSGTFTNIHRHGPGAHVLWLKGEGYSMIWPDGGPKQKEYWAPGTIIVPPAWWWHGHAVVSEEPAQYIALKLSSKRNKIHRLSHGTMRSTRTGGSMLNFEDFPHELLAEMKETFAQECARRGTKVQMQWVFGE
jgi:quercetin dioxygenase-like cupin family protein